MRTSFVRLETRHWMMRELPKQKAVIVVCNYLERCMGDKKLREECWFRFMADTKGIKRVCCDSLEALGALLRGKVKVKDALSYLRERDLPP